MMLVGASLVASTVFAGCFPGKGKGGAAEDQL